MDITSEYGVKITQVSQESLIVFRNVTGMKQSGDSPSVFEVHHDTHHFASTIDFAAGKVEITPETEFFEGEDPTDVSLIPNCPTFRTEAPAGTLPRAIAVNIDPKAALAIMRVFDARTKDLCYNGYMNDGDNGGNFIDLLLNPESGEIITVSEGGFDGIIIGARIKDASLWPHIERQLNPGPTSENEGCWFNDWEKQHADDVERAANWPNCWGKKEEEKEKLPTWSLD